MKQTLAAQIGATRFRQRLFLEGGEIPDDEVFGPVRVKIQLVVLAFCPPDANEDGQMLFASRENDTVALERLLACPRDPETRDERGKTPLHHAAEHGHVEPMRLLLEAGADAGDANRFGAYPPLHLAAQNGHLEAVRFLVANAAQINQTDAYGRTPLQLATARGHVRTARFLLQVGADKGQLMITAKALLFVAADRGRLDLARFLVEVGFDKDRTNGQGATPLLTAARAGHVDIVRFLVDSGANHRHTMHDGRTALDVASERGHAQVVRFLSELAEGSPTKKARASSPDGEGEEKKLEHTRNSWELLDISDLHNAGYYPIRCIFTSWYFPSYSHVFG